MSTHQNISTTAIWTGRILTGFCLVFLLFDATMKLVQFAPYVEGTSQLGLPAAATQPLGLLLLSATILFMVPRTAFLGAILLTGYLGGAAGITFRAQLGGHPYLFPVCFAITLWIGEWLRNENLRLIVFGFRSKQPA